ncbi:MAG: ferric reductase-like transmembrane domain-containing protein [Turneriella sp.]
MNFDRALAIAMMITLTAVTLLALKSRLINQRLVALAKQFRLHHLLALLAWALMLVHTALAFWRDWPDSLSLYFTLSDLPTVAGWIALLLFAVVIMSSWLPRLAWKHWYLLHLLSLPAFVAVALHALSYSRTRFVDFALLLSLFAILILSIFRALFDRLSAAHASRFRVQKNQPVAAGISELHLAPTGAQKNLQYPAGSIVYLRFEGQGFSRQWHPFSVASCRYEDDLRLLIKGLGADTRKIGDLHRADLVLIRGPFREFTPDFSRQQIWIAGGIGIAPFAGYAACLAHYTHGRVSLFHFIEREEQKLSLKSYAGNMPAAFTETSVHTPAHTLPDLSAVLSAARENLGAQFIVCGPPRFMRYIRRTLKHAGVDAPNIETEEFLPW